MLKYYRHEENDEFSPFYCFVGKDDSSTAENGKKTLNAILGNQHGFDTVKPANIITYLLKHLSEQDSIILDSFAGSGTTAHAVLNMNKADGGNRKFILIEMEDYAERITAERVRRVINGYGEGKNAVEGTGGDFSFYELGEPLLIGDNLNESVGVEKIREYIWYTETKASYAPQSGGHYLGIAQGTAVSIDYITACLLPHLRHQQDLRGWAHGNETIPEKSDSGFEPLYGAAESGRKHGQSLHCLLE